MRTSSPASPTPPWVFFVVALMFIFSGASALMYEVVWTRQLTTFFGSSLYGVATVLAAFMGGLALGSILVGRVADRLRQPLFWYGVFEVLIGVAALLFPFGLRACQPIIGSFYVTGGESTFYLYSLLRFVLVFLLLMVPTTLMGGTLPVLARGVTEHLRRVGMGVGGLYALNTTGAVLGVVATGFLLLEMIGVFATTLVAVGVNVVVGVAAMVLGRRHLVVEPEANDTESFASEDQAATREGEPLKPGILRLVLGTYFLSGFAALAYQVCWTRALLFSFDTLKATTYSFSGMLAVFLTGLALGSALMQGLVDRQKNLLRLYALLQAGIGFGGAISYFILVKDLPILPELAEDGTLYYGTAVANVMWRTAATIGLPTFLMGLAFPVVARLVIGSVRRLGADLSRVYALNTIGAIAGSFLCGFVLIPVLGISGTLAALVALNLTVAAVLMASNATLPALQRQGFVVLMAGAALLLPFRMLSTPTHLQRIQENEKFVHYEEGAMATVSVVENNSGDRMIYVDDVGVAGTDKIMLTDQKSLAHVPMMLLGGEAERTLSVGFGSGGASFSYTLYPNIKEIHTIEIATEVLRAAPTLTASNHGIILPEDLVRRAQGAGAEYVEGCRFPLSSYQYEPLPGFRTFDPRFRVLIDDARSYLRFTKKKYDVIATDCTDLRYKTNANLYDLEYFTLCREAISDRGLVVVWMPLGGLSDRAFRSALRTFQAVFPEMSVWYFTNQPTHYCLLIGGRGPLKIDYQAVVAATRLPQISGDLDEIALRDPDKLLSSFVCDERTLVKHLADAPLNTEDHPIIEFESPRYGYDSRPLYVNQKRLYEIQTPLTPLLTNVPAGTNPGDRIWSLQQANHVLFEGHAAYRLFNWMEAAKLYLQARSMEPSDDSIGRLLDFDELRRHYESRKDRPDLNILWTAHSLGSVYLLQDRFQDAVTVVAPMAEFARQMPTLKDAKADSERRSIGLALHSLLVRAYATAGRPERAREYAEEAKRFNPSAEQLAAMMKEATAAKGGS